MIEKLDEKCIESMILAELNLRKYMCQSGRYRDEWFTKETENIQKNLKLHRY